ncbi:MAG: hypothetical protein WC516_05450 [Patescibacteria group bacterium]|jgi:Zn-finger nucleic acid-binding protein
MKCVTCGSEIQSSFKHAIVKNECPCCGGPIMDEEMMALIEDVEKTILSEATVREETAKKLAMAIVAKYNITMKDGMERVVQAAPVIPQRQAIVARTQVFPTEPEKIKIAAPSAYQQLTMAEEQNNNAGILEMSKILASNSELSAAEREKLLEEAVKEKYNMVDQTTLDSSFIEGEEEDMSLIQVGHDAQNSVIDKKLVAALYEAGSNSVLEQERLTRLAKQQQALKSGNGSFRRNS